MSARVEAERSVAADVVRTRVRRRPGTAEQVARTASVRLSGRALVLLMLVLVVLTFAIAPLRAYLAERSQLAELLVQADELEASNAALARRIERLNDPEYLERLARECLGMVEPGETAFMTVPKVGAPHPPDC
jgi:cell division protein FtsB